MSPATQLQQHYRFKSTIIVGSGIMNTQKRILLGAAALTLATAGLAPSEAFAAQYYIKAAATTILDPNDGVTPIPMWGYALCPDGSGAGCGATTVPGPALSVPQGDNVLTVHLLNTLTKPTSLVINGLIKPMVPVWNDGSTGPRGANLTKRVRSFDAEAAPNGTADYIWNNVQPGTYLYQSGTQPQVQVQMGLYGAVTKNAVDASLVTRAEAYMGAGYDNQATLLYSEIDPVLHAAVTDGSYGTDPGPTSTFDYQPKYFLINGQPYPTNVVVPRTGTPGTTLLRFLNAGLTTHVPMISGIYWTLLAEDGKPYPYKTNQYTALLPAAKTMDVLLTPDAGGAVYSILDRRLNLSNNGVADGGMLAFLQYGSAGIAGGGSGSGNVPPQAVNDAYETVQGVMLTVGVELGVLLNDIDPDNLPQPIRAVAATGSTTNNGSYTLASNGSFTYIPPVGFIGTDTFTYQVTDGLALAAGPGTVTISVTTPVFPATVALLDNFDRANASSLGANWSQTASSSAAAPDVQVVGNEAKVVNVGLGGLAIWNPAPPMGATQGARFSTSGTTTLNGLALVLKATGGTDAAPANFVRVRCEAGQLVVATLMGGSNVSVYVTQASFPAPLCNATGALSAVLNAKGIVTTFIGGTYIGGVQLPDVSAWKGSGKIGLQLQTQDATVDNFSGGTIP